MKVILTGSTGMVGAAIARYLSTKGVTILTAGRTSNCDLAFDPLVAAVRRLPWPTCDAIIHIAAANEIACRDDPANALLTNVFGTQVVLEECVLAKIPSLIYVSTFHVYGSARGLINEQVKPSPIDNYGLTHLFSEQCVENYSKTHNLFTTVLRPSNLFGIPENIDEFNRWTLIPYAFCKEAFTSGKIVLKTPGTQFRNFVHLDHLGSAIYNAIESKHSFRLLNIAGSDTLSVRQFAELVAERALLTLGRVIEILAPEDVSVKQLEPLLFVSESIPIVGDEATSIERFVDEMLLLCRHRFKILDSHAST